jgi:glucokinase
VTTVLAVDLGGTKASFARVGSNGTVLDHQKTPAARPFEASIDQIAEACAVAQSRGPLSAIGVIVPGIFSPATGRAWCPNLWGLEEVPLLQALQRRLTVPVVVDSDRSGYVLGEAWLGAAKGLRDVVFVSIGTGIGVGIISGGSLVRGAHGIAGAAGWLALNPEWQEQYGRTGCWEAESAGPAVAQRVNAPNAEVVVERARAGDPDAVAALENAARYTGMAIANLISLLNPEAVVIGGGLMHGAGSLTIESIRSHVTRWAQPIAARHCRIELTQLGGHAGLLGAARLALDCH